MDKWIHVFTTQMFEMTSQRRYQRTIKNLAGGGGASYKILGQGWGGGGPVLWEGFIFVAGVSTYIHDIKLAKLNTSFMRTFLKTCQVIYFSWFKLSIEQN